MKNQITKDTCKHKKWSFLDKQTPAEALAECNECKLLVSHSSALQFQNIRYQNTFQKWINVGTIFISLLALIVSIYSKLCN